MRGHAGLLLRWVASADGQRLAVVDASPQGGGSNRALLYDLTHGGAAHSVSALAPPVGQFADLAFNPDGRLHVALGTGSGGGGQVRNWEHCGRKLAPPGRVG